MEVEPIPEQVQVQEKIEQVDSADWWWAFLRNSIRRVSRLYATPWERFLDLHVLWCCGMIGLPIPVKAM